MLIKDYRTYWGDNKTKVKKYLRIDDYEDTLETIVKAMFEYDGLPTYRLEEMIEEVALREGKGIIWNCDGKWIATPVSFVGDLCPEGWLKDAMAHSHNGKEKTFKDWENNPDCVVFFNNATWTPDMNIGRYADYLANVDISEEMLVIFSRIKPLLMARDENSKRQLDAIMNDLQNGKISTILLKDMASALKTTGISSEKEIEVLSLTDVTATQWLQYLSSYHNDILSRFYFLNGMDTHSAEKMAQQSVEEVTSGSEARLILPMSRLKYREQMIDLCNERFGWNASVKFSHCWEHMHQKLSPDEVMVDETLEGGDNDEVDESNVSE